ncbi:response regulator [Bdellovibrio sp. BCCA]|uniref:response regulator n=1 Tax=Bdellovibrio sp. BCCA TaxID=3136281 RepID=UPI0030F1D7C0
MPQTSQGSLELEIRRIDLLYRQNIAGLLAIFVNTMAFVFVTWGTLSPKFLIPWFVILNFSAFLRFFAYYRWQKARSKIKSFEETRFWLYFICTSLAVSGFGWGAIGFIVSDGTVIQKVITSLLISCMTAGAMITYVSYRAAMSCVILPAMGLWSIGFLKSSGEDFNLLMGVLVGFYAFLMLMIGKNLHIAVMNSLSLDAELQKSEERLRMSMESSEALTWDWDLLDDQFYWKGNINLFPEGQEELRRLLKPYVDAGVDVDAEHIVRDRSGFFHHIALRGKFHRLSDGRPFRFAGICWDVTVKKNEEIFRRERDLHEAANRAKSVFLANASHEIRTPLAAILGFSEALLRNQSLTDQAHKDVQSIYRQSNYMVSLVNDLLDLSKIETNRLYIQKAPMNPVREIEDSISVIRATLEAKKLKMDVVYETLIPEQIESDSVRFRQVLINLLSNAVKFTSEGTITVRVSFSSNTDNIGFLAIQVSDTGLGMDKTTQGNLFKPFVRGEDPEIQRVQGSGLGLALSLSLMKMMEGDLQLISSKIGEGTTFEMRLNVGPVSELRLVPVDKSKMLPPEKLKLDQESHFLKGRRVLVVDDSADLCALMKRYLSREGAEVETSENGAEAVERALAKSFDIILMDIKMPVMDGYKATALLREKGYKNPIIALTAQASVDGQQKSFEMGFDGYLSKPVDMVLLGEILRNKSEFAT